jgi:hypothetical protein
MAKTPTTKPLNEDKVHVFMRVRLSSRDEINLGMGDLTKEQVERVNNIVASALQTVNSSRDFNITDEKGVSYHFNIDHITCIEVKLG